MKVRPFQSHDAATVASWAVSAEETQRWASLESVDAQQVVDWAAADHVEAWVAEHSGLVAYGELWEDADEAEVELAHIIVDARRRGTGLGREFVRTLIARGHIRQPMVALRVAPSNTAAIAAYSAAGMERASSAEESAWNQGQPVQYVWMCSRAGQT